MFVMGNWALSVLNNVFRFLWPIPVRSYLAIELKLTRPGKQVQVDRDVGHSKDIDAHDKDLCIIVSCSLSSNKAVSICLF